MTGASWPNVFGALYSPLTASLVPALIERAEQNDFQGCWRWRWRAAIRRPGDERRHAAVGDLRRRRAATTAERGAARPMARVRPHVLRMQQACAFWPRGDGRRVVLRAGAVVDPDAVLSGELDPVTPPVWGEAVAKTLPNSKHIVMPGRVTPPAAPGAGSA